MMLIAAIFLRPKIITHIFFGSNAEINHIVDLTLGNNNIRREFNRIRTQFLNNVYEKCCLNVWHPN